MSVPHYCPVVSASRRIFATTWAAALVCAVFAVQPVLASDFCWAGGDHVGAGYAKTVYNAGVRADEDFVSTGPDPGDTIIHPMQVATDTGDFIGWGTYRGVGTHIEGAISNCPDDTSAHWHIYIDGFRSLQYFCREYGDVNGTATNQVFTLRFGDCDGQQKWRAFLNGVRLTCQLIDDDSGVLEVVGGEVAYTLTRQVIDLRYHDLDYYDAPHDTWWSWSSYNTSTCADRDYEVDIVAPDDVSTVAK